MAVAYDRRMSEHVLPASVRVALWATESFATGSSLLELPPRALPGIDLVQGLIAPLTAWRDLGEPAVLVALPRPGKLGSLPAGTPELAAAATAAQECVYAPGLGSVLVPTLETYGPDGDQGWSARWASFDAQPVPVHRVEALDLGQTELGLRQELVLLTEELSQVGAPPLAAQAGLQGLRRRMSSGHGPWGLPAGLPPRALRVIDLAGTVLALADAGLEPGQESFDASSTGRRSVLLARLRDLATAALADAANVGALHLSRQP